MSLNERKLSKSELDKREDIIMNMKKNKRDLVKKYGKDAEAVMYGRATNMAKKKTTEMRDPKLTELIKDALKNPKKADLDKDGKLSDYEKTRGAAIEKSIAKEDLESGEYGDPKVGNYDITSQNDNEASDIEALSAAGLEELEAKSVDDVIDPADYGDIARGYLRGFGRKHSLNADELETVGRKIVQSLYKGDFKAAKSKFVKRLDEVELPSSVLTKMSAEVKDISSLSQLMINLYDAIQSKEQIDFSKNQKFSKVINFLKDLVKEKDAEKEEVKEDLDLGHEDNEPSMIKGDLYQIGKAAMELYKVLDQFDDMGEVDLPSWWQSKIFKAKEAITGAQEYLDFELNEPKIDDVVDVATGVVSDDSIEVVDDIEIDETVEDYITSVDDLTEENITENMNYNKWRRAFNGKTFAKKTILLEDYNNNKKRYEIRFKYQETPKADVVSVSETHFGGHEGSGLAFAMSNMQTKPRFLFTTDDKFEFDNEEEFEKWLESGSKGLENLLSFLLGGKFADDAIENHLETGVYKIVKIKESEYIPSAAVNESTSKYSSIAERLAKELKEGLPKGFWDKKIDAEDEDQDGKVDEVGGYDRKGNKEIDSDEKGMKKRPQSGLSALLKKEDIDESYNTLVNKIKKQGKSEKAAKAIAGAVASYKAKGGGKGPTAKQK